MSTPELNYAQDEEILCFHGPLVYEAKVSNFTRHLTSKDLEGRALECGRVRRFRRRRPLFCSLQGLEAGVCARSVLVIARWDEWVDETRVMKPTPENLQKQKQIQVAYQHRKEENARQGKSEIASASGRKRIRDLAAEKEDDYLKRPEIRIPIPDRLKVQLVDDWENITKDQRVLFALCFNIR